MKGIVLAVGDELVSGQTVDTNTAWLSRELGARGVRTMAHHTVGDDRAAIAAAIRQAAQAADVVVITGGLGPTGDDLTRHALADAMGGELLTDPQALAALEERFAARGRALTDANRVQALIPAGATMIPNRLGTAPGIAAPLGGAQVFAAPGVPAEMQAMFAEQIAPRLPDGGRIVLHRLVQTFGATESEVAARLVDLMERTGDPLVGTTAAAGLIGVRVTARGDGVPDARRRAEEVIGEIRRRLGDLVVGEGPDAMPVAVADLLRRRRQTLAAAESCTGGLIGKLLTDRPGASDFFLGGVVAYANAAKEALLGVPARTLADHGAVSEAVASAMAAGARAALGADWAVAVTGIAGPAGGTEGKPVGLVYVGLAGRDGPRVWRHVLPGAREVVRRRAALAALNHVRLALLAG
jgi:nicotinamide-nucleotide amidase